jgi:hypothetical protein
MITTLFPQQTIRPDYTVQRHPVTINIAKIPPHLGERQKGHTNVEQLSQLFPTVETAVLHSADKFSSADRLSIVPRRAAEPVSSDTNR